MPSTVSNARRFFMGHDDQVAKARRLAPEEPVTSLKGIIERVL